MNTSSKITAMRIVKFMAAMLFVVLLRSKAQAQPITNDDPRAKAIIAAMNKSANEWNKGELAVFMDIYDNTATMMMPGGPVGLDSIRMLYKKKYFKGTMPKQNLRYTGMQVRLLGKSYALLTGGFTLYGNNLPERSGRYSLVMVHNKHEWKILHDHSG